MHRHHLLAPALGLALASGFTAAQDTSLLVGSLDNHKVDERSFAVQLSFAQRVNEVVGLSAEYLNEGHPSRHHRDGLAMQGWLHTPVPQRGASFSIGVGPYYYFDTTIGKGAFAEYQNDHGWGVLASVGAKWHLARRSYVEARINHVHARGAGNSNSVLIGLGYELDQVPDRERQRTERAGDRLLMVLGGQAIVNSFDSERARSYGLEYRDTVTQNMEWSVTALNEGKIGLAQRRGIAAQLWLLRPFTDRTVLELGGGGYLMRDRDDRDSTAASSDTRMVPIVTIGMRYRLTPAWRTQLSWSRVITGYHRDSDVLLLGLGKVF
ncbi:hypothetical protein [Massilia sp. DWR3-1-1]|uniref:hypothetical protein n=1 Tax=Massilia sp. DWR3-1-1 TaxID=2804559 RepID=UPI003CF87284